MIRCRAKPSLLLSAVLICLPAMAAASDDVKCGALFTHFSADLMQWALAEPTIESFSINCKRGVLDLQAKVSEQNRLRYSPAVTVLEERHSFFGMAAFYNNVSDIDIEAPDGTAWHGWKGRYSAVLVNLDNAVVVQNMIELLPAPDGNVTLQLGLFDANSKDAIAGIRSADLRYSHLWTWLRGLSLVLESGLVWLQTATGLGWGYCIILLCALIKAALIPVTLFVAKQQQRVGRVQSALEHPLREIKANYDGQEAHERIMAAHKEQGVSPFYTMRPMLGMFVQVPILVAVFNMLGELPQLAGERFWWISDLAYPDAIWRFAEPSSGLPLFGNSLNLLPILMTCVTVVAAVIYQDRHAPASENQRQKRNLYLMAGGFFVLFYPFPASMVLYWATANVLQVAQQLVTKR